MAVQKTFSLSQANALLPRLKTMLLAANQELNAKAEVLTQAYNNYEKTEQAMNKVSNKSENDFAPLRECRLQFQTAIESLSEAKEQYMQSLGFWLEEISDTGVILRDIKTGLLDFPACIGEFEYFLCWQLDEDEIGYWHQHNDGFIGRKPLIVLDEYI